MSATAGGRLVSGAAGRSAACGGVAGSDYKSTPRREFAKSIGRLAKTDHLGAKVLALYGERVQPPLRELRDERSQALHALWVRHEQLIEMLVMECTIVCAHISIIWAKNSRTAKISWTLLCASRHCRTAMKC